MRIEHVAIWTTDLERLVAFYRTYFGASVGARYSSRQGFHSRFLTFDTGARLEIMHAPDVAAARDVHQKSAGCAHLAMSVGSQDQVDKLTAQLRDDGYVVLDGPRWTGDGYYESKVLDPDGNSVEITC
jgi:lactoylglutathione lyase